MMVNDYRILVFGKAGCDKCKMLNRRIDSLLAKDDWQDFEKAYCDLDSEPGLVSFCRAECINPSRIPAFQVMKRQKDTGEYLPLLNRCPGQTDETCKNSKLYTFLGLQSDYSAVGRGIISPKMIMAVMAEARQS